MTTYAYKKQIFIKTLIDHFHHGKEQDILANWDSPEFLRALQQIPPPNGAPRDFFINPKTAISQVHYSWLTEAIQSLPENLHRPLLASMENPQKQLICRQLQLDEDELFEISPPIRPFFLEKLFTQIEGIQEVLPFSFTPQHPLRNLYHLDKNLLLELFDLLGLHDLAVKTKRIVDKTTLAYINNSLTPIRKKFFKAFLQETDKVELPEIDLSNWSGNPKILKKSLHRRGILRLSYALAGYGRDFIWHFSRKLDTGRGRIVLRHYSEEPTHLTPILTEQVQFILNVITKKGES